MQSKQESREEPLRQGEQLHASLGSTKRDNQDRLKEAEAVAHLGHYEIDVDQGTAIWSDETFRIFGIDPSTGEPTLETYRELIHPEDQEKVYQLFEECIQSGQSFDLEYRIRTPEGGIRHVHSLWRVGRDKQGRVNRFFGTIQDITEQKQAEEALRVSEEKYRALVDSSSDQIFMLSLDGVYLSSNDRVTQFGLQRGEDLKGRHISEVYSREVATFYLAQSEKVISMAEAVDFEHEMEEPRGRRYHRDTLFPIWRGEKLWAIGGICRDVTEPKRAEMALRESEKKFRLLYEEAPLSYQSLDMEGKIWVFTEFREMPP